MPDLIDGRYQLHEVLASGGMATVWRAEDTRLGRMVALKRPHPAPPGDPIHARIEREARAAASLNHPHLVTIYDVGRDENGPFLVMDLIDGPSLAEVGDELGRREAVRVVAQVADALAAVHAAGIVHRDVKPANVLMSPRGPQLTDFGIAVTGDPTTRLTRDGALVATPSYASPEQLAGEPATALSDVYSLGVVLYELLAGRLPFPEGRRAHPAPSVDDPQLDELLDRVFSPDPARRPTAEELAAALLTSAPTSLTAAPPPSGSTVPMPIPAGAPTNQESPGGASRRPLVLAGATLGILVLVGALLALPAGETPSTEESPPPETATSAPSATTSTRPPTTTVPTTTTTAPPTTTTAPSTTTEPATDPVGEARADLEASLASAHPSNLNPNEVRDLMDQADDAIGAADHDDEREAREKLRFIALRVDEKLDGTVRHESLEAVVALAEALGISLEPDRDQDRDEDDDDD